MNFKEKIDKVSIEAINEGYISGANVMILHKGELLHFNSYGYADIENKVPMDKDTIFHIYSMTKPITSVAAMILVERGIIDVKESVSKYIPAFHNQQVIRADGSVEDAARDITIWDCLNMTSGVTYPDGSHRPGQLMDGVIQNIIGHMYGGTYFSTIECIEKVAQVPLCFQPGESWLYGMSADILGAVIEIASGKRFGDFLKEEIFEPLGMVDTGFYVPKEKKHRFAQIYDYDYRVGKLKPFVGSFLGENYDETVGFESGGAGLASTIQDYSKFATMLLNKGTYKNIRILKEETFNMFSKGQLDASQKRDYQNTFNPGYNYGCLMRVLEDVDVANDSGAVGEFGWDGWTGNYFTVNPEDELIILYFIQRCGEGFGILPRKIREITREEISKKNI